MAFLAATVAQAFNVEENILPRSDWPQYVNGSALLAVPAVHRALYVFEENGNTHMVIRYPGGEAGLAWARDLRDWMVSFGVPMRNLELQPGSGGGAQLVIAVIDRS